MGETLDFPELRHTQGVNSPADLLKHRFPQGHTVPPQDDGIGVLALPGVPHHAKRNLHRDEGGLGRSPTALEPVVGMPVLLNIPMDTGKSGSDDL